MKEHIATRKRKDGVWRAFATQQEVAFRDQLQEELYTEMETSAELATDSVFSFLATTDSKDRIVGKLLTKLTELPKNSQFQSLSFSLHGSEHSHL